MKTEQKSEYEIQGEDFLKNTGTEFKAEFVGHDRYFEDDKESRDIYRITLTRGKKSYSFRFGQSIVNSGTASSNIAYNPNVRTPFRFKETTLPSKVDILGKRKAPTPYDVLACIQKYDPGTFEDFCSEFGYDTDSRKAEKTYFAVQKEYHELSRLFTQTELEQMQEIQ